MADQRKDNLAYYYSWFTGPNGVVALRRVEVSES